MSFTIQSLNDFGVLIQSVVAVITLGIVIINIYKDRKDRAISVKNFINLIIFHQTAIALQVLSCFTTLQNKKLVWSNTVDSNRNATKSKINDFNDFVLFCSTQNIDERYKLDLYTHLFNLKCYGYSLSENFEKINHLGYAYELAIDCENLVNELDNLFSQEYFKKLFSDKHRKIFYKKNSIDNLKLRIECIKEYTLKYRVH